MNLNESIKELIEYSIDYEHSHVPSALSMFSYLRYLLPVIGKDKKIIIGKPFGSQAYYYLWNKMGYFYGKKDVKLPMGIKHSEIVTFGEETLGNALGIAMGTALCQTEDVWCNISDGALQMGPTLEALNQIGRLQKTFKAKLLVTVDLNNHRLTDKCYENENTALKHILTTLLVNDIEYSVIDTNVGLFTTKRNIQHFALSFFDKIEENKYNGNIIFKGNVAFLICVTTKGKGVVEMENDPIAWHYKQVKDINEITIKEYI